MLLLGLANVTIPRGPTCHPLHLLLVVKFPLVYGALRTRLDTIDGFSSPYAWCEAETCQKHDVRVILRVQLLVQLDRSFLT